MSTPLVTYTLPGIGRSYPLSSSLPAPVASAPGSVLRTRGGKDGRVKAQILDSDDDARSKLIVAKMVGVDENGVVLPADDNTTDADTLIIADTALATIAPSSSPLPADVDELEQSYIPLSLARSKMSLLSSELVSMKSRHLALIASITSHYESLTLESRAHFEGVVDEVKSRATLRLRENKLLVDSLRQELLDASTAQNGRNHAYRLEVKHATSEQLRLQHLLISTEAENRMLQARHDSESAQFEQRRVEIDGLMVSRVPIEAHQTLQGERDDIVGQMASARDQHDALYAAGQTQAADLQSQLDACTAQIAELTHSHDSTSSSLLTSESDLAAARLDLEQNRLDALDARSRMDALELSLDEAKRRAEEQEANEAANAEQRLADASSSAASQAERESLHAASQAELLATQASLQEWQDKHARGTDAIAESEKRIMQLEDQLADAQRNAVEGHSSAPARAASPPAAYSSAPSAPAPSTAAALPPVTILVADPSYPLAIRDLESRLDVLLRENVSLAHTIAEREKAIAENNGTLARAKQEAKTTDVGVSMPSNRRKALGATTAHVGEDGEDEEAEDEGAASEYEEREVEEEFTETVLDPNQPAAASGTPGAASGAGANPARLALQSSIAEGDSSISSLTIRVSALEKELKPKVGSYKLRLAEFKLDLERKSLEKVLGFDRMLDDSDQSVEYEGLKPTDVRDLEYALSLTDSQAATKPSLTARVATLKSSKKELESNKVKLSDMKSKVGEMKASSADPALIADAESEFVTLRSAMQESANELKNNYTAYESDLKEFKSKESELQVLYARFKVDSAREDQSKPRKLSQESRDELDKLLKIIAAKTLERDALKSLAEEVNIQNTELKAMKATREGMNQKQKGLQGELSALAALDASAPSSGASSTPIATPRMITQTSTRMVMKRVKVAPARKAVPARGARMKKPSMSQAPIAAADKLIPAGLLLALKPIELTGAGGAGAGGAYASRVYTPVTPMVFKDTPPSSSSTSYAPSSSASSSSSSAPSSSNASNAADLAELASLRLQLANLNSSEPDARVRKLGEQVSLQASEAAASQARLNGMKDELRNIQGKLRDAESRAAAAESRPRVASPTPVAVASPAHAALAPVINGMIGGIDPAVHASVCASLDAAVGERESTARELDSARSDITDLERRIRELEALMTSNATSSQNALESATQSLVADHAAKVSAMEGEIADSLEMLRITKKKAKELHGALSEETAKREGLDSALVDRDGTIVHLRLATEQADAVLAAEKAVVSQRDALIASQVSELAALEATKVKLSGEVSFLEVRNVEEIKRRKEFQFKYEDAKGKVRVYARVRPFSKAEIAANEATLLRPGTNEWTLCINEMSKNYQGVATDNWRPIEFDHVFQFGLENTKGNASQLEIYEETKIFAELSVQGINCCVFAYGQSGTGKTFTMAGVKPNEGNGMTTELVGLKPRMIERVYAIKRELIKTHDVEISCYMLEIYLNKLEDVFWKLQTQTKYAGKEKAKWPEPPELKVRVDAKRKVTVDNSIILKFDTGEAMQNFCDEAESTRRVRKTGLNEESSRSHLIFALICTATDKKTGKKTTGKLSLVDLAGSERSDKTNVEGLSKLARANMMEEGIAINESLRMLKSVFRILGEANKPLAKGAKAEIVQYRGNMLTEVMQDSLGGNAKTLMFVNVGPAASNISESVDSLAYGDLVKNITNEKVSADADMEEQLRFLQVQLRAYEAKFGALEA